MAKNKTDMSGLGSKILAANGDFNISEHDIKKLQKRLLRIENELKKAHETEFTSKVGSSAYWKKCRKIDMLSQERFQIKIKLGIE